MKQPKVTLAVITLLLVSLACQTALGGGSGGNSQQPSLESEFPIPQGAKNITETNGTLLFQIKMSIDEAADFYLTELTAMGYKEDAILTVIEKATFSMVFHGHPSGQAIVVQGVDLGDGTTNISIRLEDV